VQPVFLLYLPEEYYYSQCNGLTTTGANGSVQVGGTRLYSPGANYEYNGPVAQVTGNGLTGATNLTIDNIEGVTLSGNVAVTGNIEFYKWSCHNRSKYSINGSICCDIGTQILGLM